MEAKILSFDVIANYFSNITGDSLGFLMESNGLKGCRYIDYEMIGFNPITKSRILKFKVDVGHINTNPDEVNLDLSRQFIFDMQMVIDDFIGIARYPASIISSDMGSHIFKDAFAIELARIAGFENVESAEIYPITTDHRGEILFRLNGFLQPE